MNDNLGKETIVIIGFGWVGQANAIALNHLGYPVFYYDVGEPVRHYEEKWGQYYNRIQNIKSPLEKDGANTWYIIAVGDHTNSKGFQDVSLIVKANKILAGAKGGIVMRSTILPDSLSQFKYDFYVPEFLHELYAVEECINPFFFVVGRNTTERNEPSFFAEFEKRAHRVFRGSPREASFVKYLSNIWNSARIAFVNEFGDVVSGKGNDNDSADRVINFIFQNKAYLRYGKAYGGHCLPKDTTAFWKNFKETHNVAIIEAVNKSNDLHKNSKGNNLPEWFSSWELEGGDLYRSAGLRFWLKLSRTPLLSPVRPVFRFFRRIFDKIMPVRTLSGLKKLWNRLAKKNAKFYSHPRTIYGPSISEYDFRETGHQDYECLVKKDPILSTKLKPGGVALDIGTGVGREIEFMADDFERAYGIDISEGMIEVAKRRLAGVKNITFFTTDGARIPFPDNHFNFIFSHQTFPVIPRQEFIESYVSEIKRTLKKGGVAKIEFRTGPEANKWRHTYGVSISPDWVTSLAKRHGLAILDTAIINNRSLWVIIEKK